MGINSQRKEFAPGEQILTFKSRYHFGWTIQEFTKVVSFVKISENLYIYIYIYHVDIEFWIA